MKVDVFDSENDKYIKIESIGKIRYRREFWGGFFNRSEYL